MQKNPLTDRLISDDLIPSGTEYILLVDDEQALVEEEELLVEQGCGNPGHPVRRARHTGHLVQSPRRFRLRKSSRHQGFYDEAFDHE